MESGSFELEQPYALEATLFSGQAFRWRRARSGYEGLVNGQPVWLAQRKGSIEWKARVDAHAAVAHYLRIDDDLIGFYGLFAGDAPLSAAIERWRGLHVLRQDPWETTLAFIASSASNVPKIARSLDKLARALGERVEWRGSTFHALPSPERMARGSLRQLRACEFGYRARYLHSTAKRVSAGEVQLAAVARMASDEATQALATELDGVGPKVAACIALFSMDKGDLFPVDRWVQRRVAQLYFRGRPMAAKKVEAWGRARYGPWAGYAQQYLFHDGRQGGRSAAISRR